MSTPKVACIIPARMGSSRFPGKPIAKILGHTMIEHVYRRVLGSKHVNEVYIATCDREIVQAAESFGAKAIMTSDKHTRGTDRVAEAAEQVEADIIINVQGDEPLIDPAELDKVIIRMSENRDIKCVNLIAPITEYHVFASPDVVKTVIAPDGKALYFSRQPIPHTKRENFKEAVKQIGVYFFTKEFLLTYYSWDETPLEQAEAVDMMRILEHDEVIWTSMSKDMLSVDTPQELAEMENILRGDALYQEIFGQAA